MLNTYSSWAWLPFCLFVEHSLRGFSTPFDLSMKHNARVCDEGSCVDILEMKKLKEQIKIIPNAKRERSDREEATASKGSEENQAGVKKGNGCLSLPPHSNRDLLLEQGSPLKISASQAPSSCSYYTNEPI